MKTNAIVRIIIYSLVIVILLGLLASGIGVGFLGFQSGLDFDDVFYSRTHESRIEATTAPLLEDEPEKASAPTAEPTVPAVTTEAGTPVTAFAAEDISFISIDWAAGDITLLPHDGTDILVAEYGDTDNHPMTLHEHNGKLEIQFSRQTVGFGISTSHDKDLQILVPRDWQCRELELDVASATVILRDMNIRELDFDGASGTFELANCTVDSLDIDTASGDVTFQGSLKALDMDAVSASFTGVLTNTPSHVEMDSASGDLDLTLPKDSAFTVDMEGLSSSFYSDFETTYQNGRHVHSHHSEGHGSACHIQVEGMSCDVTIRKG